MALWHEPCYLLLRGSCGDPALPCHAPDRRAVLAASRRRGTSRRTRRDYSTPPLARRSRSVAWERLSSSRAITPRAVSDRRCPSRRMYRVFSAFCGIDDEGSMKPSSSIEAAEDSIRRSKSVPESPPTGRDRMPSGFAGNEGKVNRSRNHPALPCHAPDRRAVLAASRRRGTSRRTRRDYSTPPLARRSRSVAWERLSSSRAITPRAVSDRRCPSRRMYRVFSAFCGIDDEGSMKPSSSIEAAEDSIRRSKSVPESPPTGRDRMPSGFAGNEGKVNRSRNRKSSGRGVRRRCAASGWPRPAFWLRASRLAQGTRKHRT